MTRVIFGTGPQGYSQCGIPAGAGPAGGKGQVHA